MEELLPAQVSSEDQREVLRLLCRAHELEVENMGLQAHRLRGRSLLLQKDSLIQRCQEHRLLCERIIREQRRLIQGEARPPPLRSPSPSGLPSGKAAPGASVPASWVGKVPRRRKRHPTPVFLPGESHGQRSLEGCCPRARTELDTTERLTLFWKEWAARVSPESHIPHGRPGGPVSSAVPALRSLSSVLGVHLGGGGGSFVLVVVIYLLLTAGALLPQGLFSSCGERASHRDGFSRFRAWVGSRARRLQYLRCTG